ncbi:uncharacterized protein LOC110025306 [Phalaenopsis equestris]|uniref:uncharacterized protein LOC110025306 n=1 Tax=Phalaenopsis equestris TaxID=78828 RepID=UPI0009E3F20B|nr:uncharacterized protein LOC110025306 [Phalaenopsis equestris]
MAEEEEDQQKENREEFFEIEFQVLSSIPSLVYYEHRLTSKEALLANCLIPITTLCRAIPVEKVRARVARKLNRAASRGSSRGFRSRKQEFGLVSSSARGKKGISHREGFGEFPVQGVREAGGPEQFGEAWRLWRGSYSRVRGRGGIPDLFHWTQRSACEKEARAQNMKFSPVNRCDLCQKGSELSVDEGSGVHGEKSYEHFKDVMLYERVQTITIEEVQSLIRSKELQRKHDRDKEVSGDSLIVRGRSDKKDSRNGQYRSRLNKDGRNQSSRGSFKCYHCHKDGHFKRNCPDRKNKYQEESEEPGEASVVSDDYDSAEALVITEFESSKEWILDSGCSFHMCPHKDWFETLQQENDGFVLLGDNKAHRIVASGSIMIRMFDTYQSSKEI